MGLQTCGLNLNQAYRELQPHGTPEFPCAGYRGRYTDRLEDVIPWHWHEEIEAILVAAGGLRVQVPGKTFHLARGEVIVINSNVLHFAAAEPECELRSLVFSPLLVTGTADSVFAAKYLTPLCRCAAFDGCLLEEEGAADWFEAAFEPLCRDEPGYEFAVREGMTRICLALCRRYERELGPEDARLDQDSLRLRRMLDYIHGHFSQRLELAQIARAADIGERECLRCFGRVMQISPVQYLLKYRAVQGASLLLRDRSSSVAEISNRCGFDSPSHFSQVFRRFYACTPREYRKKQL